MKRKLWKVGDEGKEDKKNQKSKLTKVFLWVEITLPKNLILIR